MTYQQKQQITQMRRDGFSYAKVADALDVPVATVKSYCRRNGLGGMAAPVFDSPEHCRRCGKKLTASPQQKVKKFCSDQCRMAWWRSHPEKLQRKAIYCITCAQCGKRFESYGNKNRKYCSRACYGKSKVKVMGNE